MRLTELASRALSLARSRRRALQSSSQFLGVETPSVQLPGGAWVRLRTLKLSDGAAWRAMRLNDEERLRPVEPTLDAGWRDNHTGRAWRSYYFSLLQQACSEVAIPFAIEVDGRFAGEITLSDICRGYIDECRVGYWVFSSFAGRGVASAACALAVDYAFEELQLHRVAATWLPYNEASGQVLKHCGFSEEGILRQGLHIDGEWEDHWLFAIVNGDLGGSCVGYLRHSGRLR